MARIRGTNASETLNGTWGNDSITGYGGDDTLSGGSGNDHLTGGDGADVLWGGTGTDTAVYDDSTIGVTVVLGYGGRGYGGTANGDRLYYVENVIGSNYSDYLIGEASDNVLTGGGGHDHLEGRDGNDTLLGGSGNDILTGGSGGDVLNGGLGSDSAYYTGSSAGVFISLITGTAAYGDAEGDVLDSIENVVGSGYHDDLWGHDGANILAGGGGSDTLKGFGGADTLYGDVGDDQLNGMDGADTLFGASGLDILSGGEGSDTLIGGANGDRMTGGEGADTFVFGYMYEIGNGGLSSLDYDLITDFQSGVDHIDLSGIDADTTADGDQAFMLVESFSGQAGQIMIVQGLFNGVERPAVLLDVNGDGREDAFFFMDTTNGALPSEADFIL